MARFSRSERIRCRADFQQVYEHGTRVHGPFFTLFLLAGQPQDSPGRLGIAATKKLGGAVVRNRAKRLIREVFRKVKIARGYDVVLVPKRELLSASLTALEAEYRAIVDRSMRRAAAQQGGRGGVRRDARARPSQGV